MYKGRSQAPVEGLKTETSPLIIDLKAYIVDRWAQATREVAEYKGYSLMGSDSYTFPVKKAIFRLFLTIKSSLKAEFSEGKAADYVQMDLDLNNNKTDIETYLKHFYFMDSVLYDKGLTKYDNRVRYDRSDAEASNIHKGY